MVYAIPRSEVVLKSNMMNNGSGWNDGNGTHGNTPNLEEYDKYPKARALFDYEAEVLGDLTLRAGDIIIVIDKDTEGGWWTGRIGNREGLFPSNYAEMIDDKEIPNMNRANEPKDGDILIARFDYNEGGKEELAFSQGDKIILQAKDDTGWWLGKLQKSGVVGWFAPDLVVPIDEYNDDEKENDQASDRTTNNGYKSSVGSNSRTNGNSISNNSGDKKSGGWKSSTNNTNSTNTNSTNTNSTSNTNNTNNTSNTSSAVNTPKSSKSIISTTIPAVSSPSASTTSTTSNAGAGGDINESGEFFDLDRLQKKKDLPSTVNLKRLECYLNDEEFESTFKMNKDTFFKLPLWKQRRAKKEVDLF